MSKRPPNIHPSVAAICRRLDLVPEDVGKIILTPTRLTATIYKRNESGAKYIDLESNKPAAYRKTFEVRA